MRGCEEDERDESLRNEEDGEEKDEQCLCTGHAAEEDEECRKAKHQEEHGGQTVVVDDGVAFVLRTDDDVLTLCRVDVEGGVVQCTMCDCVLAALCGAGINADLYLVLRTAGRKILDLVLDLRDVKNLRLVRRRIAVLSARQMGECIEEDCKGETYGKEARKALWMDFHGEVLSWNIETI